MCNMHISRDLEPYILTSSTPSPEGIGTTADNGKEEHGSGTEEAITTAT